MADKHRSSNDIDPAISGRAELRTILTISLPLITAYLAEIGMMITDMIIVGRLGNLELAAVGLTADWMYVLLLIGMGVVSIVGVLTAQSLGAGDSQGVRNAVEQGNIAALILSVPIMLCVWYLGPLLALTGQDPRIIALITDYARPLMLSVVPALLFVVLRNFVAAMASTRIVMLIGIVALALNLLLNLGLVLGKFGLPALGVVGAAYGTSIVNWLMFVSLVWHVSRDPRFGRFQIRLFSVRFHWTTLREVFALGIPVAGAQILAGAMFTVAAVLMGLLGTDELAAQQIIYSVIYVALSIALGIGDAARVRVAYGVGLGSAALSRRSANISFVLTLLVMVLASAALWLYPEQLTGVFLNIGNVDNASVLQVAVSLAALAAIYQLFDGMQIVSANALRGLKDTRSPFWIAAVGYWLIGLGSGAWFCFGLQYGAQGLWWGLIVGVISTNALMSWRYSIRIAQFAGRAALSAPTQTQQR